jgi:adenosine deaminase
VEGTLRPATVVDLAAKHGIVLPTTDVDRIYHYTTIYEFLEIFRLVNPTVIDRDDFARVAYESLRDGATLGNLKYREMFFNPTLHTPRGVAMDTIIDGLIDGCRAAESDFGVRLDVLGCERLDHGYHILEDPEVVARCRDQGITFTCCPTSTAMVYNWPDFTTHPITAMIAAGLAVTLNSDDPTMFHTDIGTEYVEFCGQNNYGRDVVRRLVLQGVDAT